MNSYNHNQKNHKINAFIIIIHPFSAFIIRFIVVIGIAVDNTHFFIHPSQLIHHTVNPDGDEHLKLLVSFDPLHPLGGPATPARGVISLNVLKWQFINQGLPKWKSSRDWNS